MDPVNTKKRLEVFTAGGEVVVKNLVAKPCSGVDDAQKNRRVTRTQFIRHHSSRSHCIVMISVTQRV